MPGAPLLVLGWSLGGQRFGVDVSRVFHVETVLPMRGVPRPAPGIQGVTFYQGRAIPVLDLARVLLGEEEHEWPANPLHMVMQDGSRMYAARIDGVMRIYPATTDDLKLVLPEGNARALEFARASVTVGDGEELLLIDFRRVVRDIGLRFPERTRSADQEVHQHA